MIKMMEMYKINESPINLQVFKEKVVKNLQFKFQMNCKIIKLQIELFSNSNIDKMIKLNLVKINMSIVHLQILFYEVEQYFNLKV